MRPARSADSAHAWRVPGVDGVELFRATYAHHTFARHAHEAMAFGVVDGGVGEFWCQGATHRAPPDTLVLIGAGEAHTGGVVRSASAPLRYRMVYVTAAALRVYAGQGAVDAPFRHSAPRDPAVAAHIRRLHDAMARPASPLEHEHRLAWVLDRLLRRHGRGPAPAARDGREPAAVAAIREYLHAHLASAVSARELSELTGLHPAYLNRVFSARTGMPPHAYLTDLRVQRARKLLAAGRPVSAAAYETGFADQSHLTRCFKRAVGITPGAYQDQVRGGGPAAT